MLVSASNNCIKKLIEQTSLLNKEQGDDQLDANKEHCSSAYPTVLGTENSHDGICTDNFNCFCVIYVQIYFESVLFHNNLKH